MRVVFVGLALGACTDPGPYKPFTELPGLTVGMSFDDALDSDGDATQPTRVFVTISYDFRALGDDSCGAVDAGGNLNGTELTFSPGVPDTGANGELVCDPASLGTSETMPLLLGIDEPARLELHDQSGNMIVAEYPAGAARVAWSAAGWTFAPGQQVALDWSNTAELSSFTPADVFLEFERTDHQGFYMQPDALTGTQVLFTVPQPVPAPGEGRLVVSMGPGKMPLYSIPATSCVGATRCLTLRANRTYEHSAVMTAL